MRYPVSSLTGAMLLVAALFSTGCNGPGQPTFRVGALPFHGLMLHARADPEHLGHHRYRSLTQFGDGEVGRGIIYTQRAGFVDVAHIRDTADWARYIADRVAPALREGASGIVLDGSDHTRVHLHFDYPPGWWDLPEEERESLIRELAIRCGQEGAYALTTWHELITWYDYGIVPLVSERPSAFTYDDVISHVVGLEVVGRALRDEQLDYNAAMTRALDEVMSELGPASPRGTRQAVLAVKGWWWKRGQALKRHLDTGLDDGEVMPMVIEGFEVEGLGPTPPPTPFVLPKVAHLDVEGLDFSGFLQMELEPRLGVYRKLRRYLPGAPNRVVPGRDIPVLMAVVRREMQERIDPHVDVLAVPARYAGPPDDVPRARTGD